MITTDSHNLTEDPLALLDGFLNSFNQRDAEGIMAMMTEDCVFENTYPPPNGERFEGQQAVRDCWERLFAAAPQVRFEIEEIFHSEDRAFARWLYHWVSADGTQGHIRGVDIFRLHNGKIAEKLSYVKG